LKEMRSVFLDFLTFYGPCIQFVTKNGLIINTLQIEALPWWERSTELTESLSK
jgi:hypothetical protein